MAAENQFMLLYQRIGGEHWRFFRALAIKESGENPYAVSPAGVGVGLWQMGGPFWADYGAGGHRCCTHCQALALRRFAADPRIARFDYEGYNSIFHLGLAGFHTHTAASDVDRDGDLTRFRAAWQRVLDEEGAGDEARITPT